MDYIRLSKMTYKINTKNNIIYQNNRIRKKIHGNVKNKNVKNRQDMTDVTANCKKIVREDQKNKYFA